MTLSREIIRAEKIHKTYPSRSGKGVLEVLKNVDLTVHSSQITAVIGSSGCGKSTLLHLLGGLDRPDSGSVYWDGQSIYDWDPDKLAEERNRRVGFIFQFHHLLPEFTAVENVYMPALIAGQPVEKAEERAMQLLDQVGMADRSQHRPSQLSGGEQQRVAICRALMNKPGLLLADEPTGNLDEENTELVLSQLFDLRKSEQVAMVLITHEKEIASRCNTMYELKQGALHPYTLVN